MLTAHDQLVIEARIANDGPSTVAAYLLWLFLGLLSAHRFYLGRPISAVIQILLNIALVGIIWVLVDAFLIPRMARQKRDGLRRLMAQQAALPVAYKPS